MKDIMNSTDYHMLAAFQREVSLLELKQDEPDIDTVINYMKSRIHELEQKFKKS
jgi:hypothetical protein